MKKILKNLAIIAFFAGSCVSCDYLDVSSEMSEGEYLEIFNNASRSRRWYGDIFISVPDYSNIWSGGSGMKNVWTGYTDECFNRNANNAGKYDNWTSSSALWAHRWGDLYQRIRQANIYLTAAHPIIDPADPTFINSTSLSPEEVEQKKAIARFMRAVYHYYLMEMYGPVPIIDRELLLTDNLDIPRNTLDELIEWIDTEIVESMAGMEQEPYTDTPNLRAVPTKGVAMAYRAKLWVYAASPLFNGGFTEALSLRNPDGKQLFPPKDDGTKLAKAVQYLREFLDYAEDGRYELYVDASGDPNQSIYKLFQEYNREIIWITSRMTWDETERMSLPRCEQGGVAEINLVQELIDDFYMADGLPIKPTSFLEASTDYTEEGFGIVDGYEVSNMYVGREPRFYATVTFSGKKWHVSGTEVQMYKGGNADNSATDGAPRTGYFLYKRNNRTVHSSGSNPKTFARPSIIFRLAEFHLLYAEMLNELEPENPDVLRYLNGVRNRAGLPNIEDLNSSIAGNKDLQRAAIQRESRLELATEGQRYFDVRRWMIAESHQTGRQGGDFHGMNINGNKIAFHTRVVYHSRYFARKNYLYPIPVAEVQKSHGQIVQNPGW